MFLDIPFTFKYLGVLLFIINLEHIKFHITRVWENNKNKTLNDLLVEALWNTSYAFTFVKYRCGKLYSTFPLVRTFVHALSVSKKSAKPVIEYPWANITQLIEDESGKLRVVENTFDLNDFEWQYKSISENLLKLNNICKDVLQNNEKVVECLLLFAENADWVRSRVINRKNMDMAVDTTILTNMSNIKFLLIDYLHPDLEESYELVVDKPYFMEGNHILSGAFVGLLLSKQGYSDAFDKSYRVVIIDQEVKNVEWTYADYIELVQNRKYVINVYEEEPSNNVVPKKISANNSMEDEDTKSWDKVDKE
jgi:hypothetical protein